ncbi:hypothetical protein BDV29DRAFT_162041 [Aspergillus leporis]|uniref:Tautomerase cis-CaaD-like domain-containing protein n=1 Tax=Aspergillus leporis TaxID=41062 RepID=A0A5N5WM69_9EURO|nr:hypothetical protein BDV29DRAFT_162041 [Aspergillus leporis]
MPFYEVQHFIPLEKSERDELAKTITHTRKFTTPSAFVNAQFTEISQHHNYVAGKESTTNRIIANVRTGATRTATDFDELAQSIQNAWDRIVNKGEAEAKKGELTRVFVMGSITAGLENGLLLPRAGKDIDWLKEDSPKYQELAD